MKKNKQKVFVYTFLMIVIVANVYLLLAPSLVLFQPAIPSTAGSTFAISTSVVYIIGAVVISAIVILAIFLLVVLYKRKGDNA